MQNKKPSLRYSEDWQREQQLHFTTKVNWREKMRMTPDEKLRLATEMLRHPTKNGRPDNSKFDYAAKTISDRGGESD